MFDNLNYKKKKGFERERERESLPSIGGLEICLRERSSITYSQNIFLSLLLF